MGLLPGRFRGLGDRQHALPEGPLRYRAEPQAARIVRRYGPFGLRRLPVALDLQRQRQLLHRRSLGNGLRTLGERQPQPGLGEARERQCRYRLRILQGTPARFGRLVHPTVARPALQLHGTPAAVRLLEHPGERRNDHQLGRRGEPRRRHLQGRALRLDDGCKLLLR